MKRAWLALALVLCAGAVSAHKPSDSYLRLSMHSGDAQIQAQWDIALRDLDLALELDTDRDGAITWGELRTRERDVFGYALQRLGLAVDDMACTLQPGETLVDDHSDGAYAVLRFAASCPGTSRRLAPRTRR